MFQKSAEKRRNEIGRAVAMIKCIKKVAWQKSETGGFARTP